jgi:TatA/E family protein of Tat protein translocase
MQFAGLGGLEWVIIIGLIIVVFFGVRKIPELARSFGKASAEFHKARIEAKRELQEMKSEGNIVGSYDLKNITIGTIGSHSALEIMDGAKDENLKTICLCQKGRELPYRRFKRFKRLTDEIILLDKFSNILYLENQEKLRQTNSIMVAHRGLHSVSRL